MKVGGLNVSVLRGPLCYNPCMSRTNIIGGRGGEIVTGEELRERRRRRGRMVGGKEKKKQRWLEAEDDGERRRSMGEIRIKEQVEGE